MLYVKAIALVVGVLAALACYFEPARPQPCCERHRRDPGAGVILFCPDRDAPNQGDYVRVAAHSEMRGEF
jgi:hypothetical protein